MSTVTDRTARPIIDQTGAAKRRGPIRFALTIGLLALGVMITAGVVVLLIPDANDYARASLLKHDRIASLPSPKIVLIGGSNLSYGIDSAVLERDTQCPVVNMGMNGYLGVRFMLDEAKPYLRKSDIVVVSLEYENFFNSVHGNFTDHLMIAKTNPKAWSFLAWWQKLGALSQVPMVAQQKVFRLIRSYVSPPNLPEYELIERVETFAGFNKYGDLTSHLNETWPFPDTDRFDLSNRTVDSNIIPELQAFTSEMNRRGVHTVYSYSPLKRNFYDLHSKAIAALHNRLANASPLVVLNPPTTFVFDDGLFFDSIYHLNAKGRLSRTKQLAADIRQAIFRGGDCAKGPLAEQTIKQQGAKE
jgi:hypothetical protein